MWREKKKREEREALRPGKLSSSSSRKRKKRRGKNKNISSPIPLSLNPNPVRFAPTGLQDRSSFGISGWSERSCAWRGGLSIPVRKRRDPSPDFAISVPYGCSSASDPDACGRRKVGPRGWFGGGAVSEVGSLFGFVVFSVSWFEFLSSFSFLFFMHAARHSILSHLFRLIRCAYSCSVSDGCVSHSERTRSRRSSSFCSWHFCCKD